jgi:hypothetical protein
MSNYVKATNFYSKDALLTGNPDKLIKGAEIDDEFNAIATAIATKADLNNPNFTGTATVPTAPTGTNTSQVASTAFVKNTLDAAAANIAITGGTIDNVEITNSTISECVIEDLGTPLAVADGGTGASSLTANRVLLGNGTDPLQTVAPGTSGNVLTSNGTTWASTAPLGGVGVGQTWQDVRASRAHGTTYTNNTSKPIMVNVYPNSNGKTMDFIVNGLTVSRTNADENGSATMSVIVPVGASYSVTGDNDDIDLWVELR